MIRFLAWLELPPRQTVACTLLFAYGIAIAAFELPIYYLLAISLIFFLLFCFSQNKKYIACFLLIPILGWTYCTARIPIITKQDLSLLCKSNKLRKVVFSACVIDVFAKTNDESNKILVSCQNLIYPYQEKLTGKTIIKNLKAQQITIGQQIKVYGYAYLPIKKQFPWEFDYCQYLAKQGIFSLVQANKISLLSNNSIFLNKYFDNLRSKIISLHIKALGNEEGSFVSALVMGNRSIKLPDIIVQEFQNLGLSHVLAASGFNLTIVTGSVWYISKRLIHSPRIVSLISMCSLFMFIGLAGASPSVIRASIMCTFILISKALFRNIYSPAALCLALLFSLLIDPLAITDIGLQLSYAATSGIILGANKLTKTIQQLIPITPKIFAELFSVILLAQASTLPIQIYYFWNIGIWFFIANILLALTIPTITIIAFVSSTFVCISTSFAVLLDKLAHYPIAFTLYTVHYLSHFTGAKIVIGPATLIAVIIYYLVFFLNLAIIDKINIRIYSIFAFSISLYLLFWRPSLAPLTMFCTKDSFVCLDGQKNIFCYGNVNDKKITRFLSYFGAQNTNKTNTNYTVKEYNKKISITNKTCQKSIVLTGPPWQTIKPIDTAIKIYYWQH